MAILLALAMLPFLLLAIVATLWFVLGLRSDLASRQWPRATGRITEARIVSNRDCNGLPGWHWHICFSYTIPDSILIPPPVIELDSDADWLEASPAQSAMAEDVSREADGSETPRFRYQSRKWAKHVLDAFPIGQSIVVAFDPRSPRSMSTIRPGFRTDIAFPATLALIGWSAAIILLLAIAARM